MTLLRGWGNEKMEFGSEYAAAAAAAAVTHDKREMHFHFGSL
jgi:hypothetical protein